MCSVSKGTILRDPRPSDVVGIVDIYNHYVATSAVTFNEKPWTVEATREWMENHDNTGPWQMLVVAEAVSGEPVSGEPVSGEPVSGEPVSGDILGYAFSGAFRDKDAYRYSCETTVYVAPTVTEQGIGKQLLGDLVHRLRAVGAHRAYAVIAVPHDTSVALHAAAGYKHVGTMDEVGHKFGEWRSTELWECRLA